MSTAEIGPGIEPINGDFEGKDILSVSQFTPEDVSILVDQARAARTILTAENRRDRESDLLKGAAVDLFFYQPSTRTVLSFEMAAEKLGALTRKTTEVKYSSVMKGESFQDTMRTLQATYADAIVLRHPDQGSVAEAAAYVDIPVINGGDGPGEHPSQALLDIYTILTECNTLDGLTVTMVGDLKYGRTVHSLARLLSMYEVKLNYVSPPQLRMPKELVDELTANGTTQTETHSLEDVLAETNVFYDTRVQREHFEGPDKDEEYEAVKDMFIVTEELMAQAPSDMVLMHPLPRVNEIEHRVDHDKRAAYFRQISRGVEMRMGILAKIFGVEIEPRD